MKPKALRPLVGRTIWLRYNGERSGKVVGVPASDTLTVRFLDPHGTHRVDARDLIHVYYFGKRHSLTEFLERMSRKEVAK